MLIIYSSWNVLLSHLNGEQTPNEHAEHTQSERCVNDMWTLNSERTHYANGLQACELSERWTMGERKMCDLFGKPRVISII